MLLHSRPLLHRAQWQSTSSITQSVAQRHFTLQSAPARLTACRTHASPEGTSDTHKQKGSEPFDEMSFFNFYITTPDAAAHHQDSSTPAVDPSVFDFHITTPGTAAHYLNKTPEVDYDPAWVYDAIAVKAKEIKVKNLMKDKMYAEAEPLCRQLLWASEQLYGPNHEARVRSISDLIVVLEGQMKETDEVKTLCLKRANIHVNNVKQELHSLKQEGRHKEAADLEESIKDLLWLCSVSDQADLN